MPHRLAYISGWWKKALSHLKSFLPKCLCLVASWQKTRWHTGIMAAGELRLNSWPLLTTTKNLVALGEISWYIILLDQWTLAVVQGDRGRTSSWQWNKAMCKRLPHGTSSEAWRRHGEHPRLGIVWGLVALQNDPERPLMKVQPWFQQRPQGIGMPVLVLFVKW